MLLYLQMIDTPDKCSKLEEIYLTYRQIMYAVAFSILRNEKDAEDAVHDAFVKIAEHIGKIGEPHCPKTKNYIVTIVENKAIDLYRIKQRHPHLSLDEVAVGISVEYQGDNLLAYCMAQLPARYRNILLLRYYHGCDILEVARLMDISVANAYKLENRAKKKLEKLCREVEIL